MVWIYLAASEESVSHLATGLNQLPIAKSTPIVKQCSSQEWPMNHYPTVLSGMTLKHWTEIYSKEPLTSFTEDFPARILVLQDMEKAWQESEAVYFSRSCDCVAKLSHDLSFWKMFQPLLPEEEQKWLDKLPRWGMTVDGALYPLRQLERYTVARDGSYWLTPSTMECLPIRTGEVLENALHRGKNRSSRRKCSGRLNEQVAYPMMWPTPSAQIAGQGAMLDTLQTKEGNPAVPNERAYNPQTGRHVQITLNRAVQMWPTPTKTQVEESYEGYRKRMMASGNPKNIGKVKPQNLAMAVKMATPTASQANKPIRLPSPSRQREDLQDSIGRLNPESIGKKLCPRWVSVLMGYPTMWTDCAPLETQSCQPKLEKLFAFCRELNIRTDIKEI